MTHLRRYFSLGVLGLLACGGAHAPLPSGETSPPSLSGLRPGDAIQVKIWQEDSLSGSFDVDTHGVVVLPLLGERQVTGVLTEDIEHTLVDEYRVYLANPSVNVTVLRRIAIFGEVRNPNLYMMDATVTLRDALAMAGGILPTGDRNKVRLLRDGHVLVASLDLGRMIADTPIQSGDQIEVGQQGWWLRNRSVLATAFGAATTLVAALIVSR